MRKIDHLRFVSAPSRESLSDLVILLYSSGIYKHIFAAQRQTEINNIHDQLCGGDPQKDLIVLILVSE